MSEDKPKTLFAIRISKNSKIGRDLFHVFLLLGGIGLFFIVIFGVQYMFCISSNPNMTMKECLKWNAFMKEEKK